MQTPETRHMLISVTNKAGIEKFKALTDVGWQILSTGGTADKLTEANIPVTTIEDYTGMPEMMDGRLKTLHPSVQGGILARRDNKSDTQTVVDYAMELIDLVAVNLYPFIQNPCIGNIDIGGPTMIRAAAKNYKFVTVIVDPADYEVVIQEILTTGSTTLATRRRLAQKAFKLTYEYDQAIEAWFKLTDEDNVQDSA